MFFNIHQYIIVYLIKAEAVYETLFETPSANPGLLTADEETVSPSTEPYIKGNSSTFFLEDEHVL